MKITIIAGSPRLESITVRVAYYLNKLFKERFSQHEFTLLELRNHQIPLVQKVWTKPDDVPMEFRDLAHTISSSDAFVLVSPEYNGSMSSALRNLFDHFPKQTKKTFGIVSASEGAMGGIRGAVGMQNQICGWFGIPCPNMLIVPFMDKKFDAEGNLLEEKFLNNATTFANEFIWLAEAVNSKKQTTKTL
jgi:chromate reductase, NAD(P)H dehydrogenase (quinone)